MTFMWALLSGEWEANGYREEDHKEMTAIFIIQSYSNKVIESINYSEIMNLKISYDTVVGKNVD